MKSNHNNSSPPSSGGAKIVGLKGGLASALAAICTKTLLQPFDALKVAQQNHRASTGATTTTSNARAAATSLTLREACRTVYARGGIGGFYAGLAVTIVGAVPSVAIYFGVYNFCKEKLLKERQESQIGRRRDKTLSIAASAAIGTTIAAVSRCPAEVVKQHLQTRTYASTSDALTHVLRSDNPWRLVFPKGGIAIQTLHDVPCAVLTLTIYESLKDSARAGAGRPHNIRCSSSTGPSSRMLDFVLGGVAGGIASYVTTPIDVTKTRLQINSANYGGSVVTCVRSLWHEGGPRIFLRGSTPRLMHKVGDRSYRIKVVARSR